MLAMAGIQVISAPGGGGGFEVIMSTFFAGEGIPLAVAIAATLLYRVAAFWLPCLLSVLAFLVWTVRRGGIRRASD